MRTIVRLGLYAAVAVLVIVITAACSIPTIPEKVQVKTSPTYEIPAGSTTITLSDYFSLDEDLIQVIQDELGDPTAEGVVENDTYRIKGAFSPFIISTDEFFNQTVDLESTVSDFNLNYSFSVPNVGQNSAISKNIGPVDVPAVSFGSLDPIDAVEADAGVEIQTPTVSSSDFT